MTAPIDAARHKLLYKVAMSYYGDDLTQDQIARRFGLSRIKVSRLLQQARRQRIVQISIVPPQDDKPELERALEARYGLDEVVIVASSGLGPPALQRDLGAGAAEYLARSLQGGEVVGLSWGSTLHALVDALPAQTWPDMRIVQIIGGLGRSEAETHGADLTRRMAEAFAARPLMLSAPGIVSSPLVRDALLADPQIAETLALAARADIALVGIGAPGAGATLGQLAAILAQAEVEQLKALGAVGDIALRFFDQHGVPIHHEVNNRIIGLDLAQIRRIARVIGVAGGDDKFGVIRAAARGRLISVLITDARTAARLMQEDQEQ